MDTVNNFLKKMEYKKNDYSDIYTITIIEKSNNNNNIKIQLQIIIRIRFW